MTGKIRRVFRFFPWCDRGGAASPTVNRVHQHPVASSRVTSVPVRGGILNAPTHFNSLPVFIVSARTTSAQCSTHVTSDDASLLPPSSCCTVPAALAAAPF